MTTAPAVSPFFMAAVGGGITLLGGSLLYWLKDAWSSRKDRAQRNEDGLTEAQSSQMELERRIFHEFRKIQEGISNLRKDMSSAYDTNKERIYVLDKELTKNISKLSTKVEVLTNSTVAYQKDVCKMEGRLEDVCKAQADSLGEMRMTGAKFDKIFQYIDASPRATDRKVSGVRG